jgi:hypothetical protein
MPNSAIYGERGWVCLDHKACFVRAGVDKNTTFVDAGNGEQYKVEGPSIANKPNDFLRKLATGKEVIDPSNHERIKRENSLKAHSDTVTKFMEICTFFAQLDTRGRPVCSYDEAHDILGPLAMKIGFVEWARTPEEYDKYMRIATKGLGV